jgi:hypothetical protein
MVTIQRFGAALLMAGAIASAPARADPACAVPEAASQQHPMPDRQERLAQLETLPDTCLKTMVVKCSDTASEQMLDPGSAATCSMSYEALLKRGFGGDFQAMLAWWRSQRTASAVN